MGRVMLAASLVVQAVFLGLVVGSQGFARIWLFGLFWLATLSTLIIVMSLRRWWAAQWHAFGSWSVSVIVGVLLSGGLLSDPVGAGITTTGSLLVSSFLCVLPD